MQNSMHQEPCDFRHGWFRALILRPRPAFSTVGVYILIGLIAIPVSGGGTSGLGKLLTSICGFYFGFLF
ncbi:biotin transporter BioY, partial [Clostridioides difficile]|uniref:biotin transporter BioY n=1 Tax=Clostridioides difficile TaxID=1496 RepID=UPI001A90EC06